MNLQKGHGEKNSSPWCETTHNVPILSVRSLNTGHNLDQSLARVLSQASIWLSLLGVAFRVQSNLSSFAESTKELDSCGVEPI